MVRVTTIDCERTFEVTLDVTSAPSSGVTNVETKIAEELGAKLVEIANKRVPRPYRFLFLAPPAGRLGPLI